MLPLDQQITSSPGGGQMPANNKGWGTLATELRVHTLKELDATDLLSCSKVDRAFKTLINDTPSLRYKLLLHAAGMRDGPPGGFSVSKRMTQLEKYENTWKTGNIPIREQPSAEGGPLAGGLFITIGDDKSQLEIQRPASFFSGVPEKIWNVNLSELSEHGGPDMDEDPMPSSAYAVDLARDLLVFMVMSLEDPEGNTEASGFPECYVLSLSGVGEIHPLAAQRELYSGSHLGLSSPEADVEIVGDLVGCTVLGMDICMSVYNWKTGDMLWADSEWESLDLDGMGDMPEYDARCHILDSTHVLKILKYDLTVYRITAADKGGSTAGELVCNLKMPALANGFEASYCASYIQRPPETPDCSPHFECDPSLTVLVVEYDVRHKSHSRKDRAMLFAVIPISTILARAHVPPTTPKVSWEDWGALGARLVLVPYQGSCSAKIDAFGSRVAISVSLPSVPAGMVDVAVLDVRKGAEHTRHSELTVKRDETSPFLVLDRYTKKDTPIFKGPVEAKMPYRIVRTRCDISGSSARGVSLLSDGLCA